MVDMQVLGNEVAYLLSKRGVVLTAPSHVDFGRVDQVTTWLLGRLVVAHTLALEHEQHDWAARRAERRQVVQSRTEKKQDATREKEAKGNMSTSG